ncbi:hypothetical protein [Pectobacterium phage Zenivior_B1]|uniref:Uncharacterized protein n=2 Tax=Phimunavirus zenivior TaxID=2733345 RepID=A0A3G8FJT8_9CAUD|nr:hypothetical protein HOU75_gp21 [Pectobacterium phage Zenivior]AZF94982.1 hypothetical protein [Pectobacterium phage Zenivior]AZF95059.1 hypothetical protein [Pectobacterium phage Zenivior_B1]
MNPLTPRETAELFWLCLEQQRNCVGSWDVFKHIPPVLQVIAPLRRCITYRSTEKGVRLVRTMRMFDAEAAEKLCAVLDYNLVQSLASGYKEAQNEFYAAVQRYYECTLAYQYYA